MEKKNVLIIAANGMGNSGVPNVFMQIVRNLSNEYNFDILLTREDYYYRDEFLSFGGQIFLSKEKNFKNKFKRIIWRLIGSRCQVKKALKEIFKRKEYSIVHSFKESESGIYLKIAKKYGINRRIVHNNRQKENFSNFLLNLYQKRMISKTIKYSTNNISVSKLSGDSFFKDKQYRVVYNAINLDKYYFRDSVESSKLNLLQIGTFLPLKNQIFSLEVIKILHDKYPNLTASFIGSIYDNNYYEKFVSLVEKFKLQNNVHIYDGNKEQSTFLDNATITMMPSTSEGLGLTIIESQACGITVFASSTITKEVDLGNVRYLDLDANRWAEEIDRYFLAHKNKRHQVDVSKFSSDAFSKAIRAIYSE